MRRDYQEKKREFRWTLLSSLKNHATVFNKKKAIINPQQPREHCCEPERGLLLPSHPTLVSQSRTIDTPATATHHQPTMISSPGFFSSQTCFFQLYLTQSFLFLSVSLQ